MDANHEPADRTDASPADARPTHTKFGGLIDYERGGCYTSSGAKTTDVPCPRDGELVNVSCWQCGWKRDPAEREQTVRNHPELNPTPHIARRKVEADAELDEDYSPLFAERRCRVCGYWRGQHVGDPADNATMRCPTTFVPGIARHEEDRGVTFVPNPGQPVITPGVVVINGVRYLPEGPPTPTLPLDYEPSSGVTHHLIDKVNAHLAENGLGPNGEPLR